MKRLAVVVLAALLAFAVAAQAAVTINTVPVRNAGNAADSGNPAGQGAVADAYNIGKYEVTAGQYTDFLNAVAKTDTSPSPYDSFGMLSDQGCKIQRSGSPGSYSYSVASDYANRPVNYVSFANACRFANWLHNGQPIGAQGPSTTEDGVYKIARDDTVDPRNATWKWAVTSEDEWYKAAYHKNDGVTANYFVYPTKSNTPPGRNMADPLGNNANYGPETLVDYPIDSHTYYTTNVGEFQNSASPYGTFDQGGNVWEWNESIFGPKRGARGGGFSKDVSPLAASVRGNFSTAGAYDRGFRVVNLPMTFVWKGGDSSGPTDWATPANWIEKTSVPDGPGTAFSFGNQPAVRYIADMGAIGRTVGSLTFTSGTNTTIQSTDGKSLTLDNGGGAATVTVAGNHTITAPVVLNSDVSISGTGSLDLSGGISGNRAMNLLSGSLIAKSIQVDTLTIGAGASVTIRETTGTAANAVPEPSSFALIAVGAIGLLTYARRRRKRTAPA